jgi:hydrogenase maturation protease
MPGEPRVQVIGIGSPYGADRLGWLVVEQLEAKHFCAAFPPGRLQLQACPSPAQLPTLIQSGTAVLLIDALRGRPFGEIQWLSWQELEQAPLLSGSHGLGLREILPLIEVLYSRPEAITLLGIGVGDGFAEPLDALPGDLYSRLEQEITEAVTGLLAS